MLINHTYPESFEVVLSPLSERTEKELGRIGDIRFFLAGCFVPSGKIEEMEAWYIEVLTLEVPL